MTTLVRVELEKLRTTGLPWALLAASTALTLALALHAGGPPPGGSWTYRSMYLRPDLFGEVAPRFRADIVRDRGVFARLLRFHRSSESPGSTGLERES